MEWLELLVTSLLAGTFTFGLYVIVASLLHLLRRNPE